MSLTGEKKKVLDLGKMSKEEQRKALANPEAREKVMQKKFCVTIEVKGKIRFMYLDDPVIAELYALKENAKIIKINKIA